MASPELRLVGRWTHTGTLGANTPWSPPPILTNEPNLPQGMLAGNQVGEIARIRVYSPVNGGVAEDLRYVQLVLDGKDYAYVWVSGRQDTSMAPPLSRIRRGKELSLGSPFVGRNGAVAGLLEATCPKFISSCSIKAWAGATAVTQDFVVEIWGYVWNSVDLASQVPLYDVADVLLTDQLNKRSFRVVGRQVNPAGDWRRNWKSLPGGDSQGLVSQTPVFPIVRRARNANATTANQTYIPQYQNSSATPAVQNPQDNMYFQLDAAQAVLLQRMGLVGPPAPNGGGYDVLSAWVATPSETQKWHPEGGIPSDYNLGELRFGLSKGETNKFDALPELPQGPQLLTAETAYLTFVDNGTSIPANNVMLAMSGLLIGDDATGV